MKQLPVIIVLSSFLILYHSTVVFAEKSPLRGYGVESISSKSIASTAVENITGIPMDSSNNVGTITHSIKVVPTVESQVAFVASEINNGPAWLTEVVFLDLGPLIYTPEEQAIAEGSYIFPKRFQVFIDSLTGRFLEARTVYDGEHEHLFREPTESEAMEQLSPHENYHGLPAVAPKVTMIEAMKACKGRPLVAKEMTISYVLYSFQGSVPIPCWVMLFRGLPAFNLGGNFNKVTPSHTTMRHVVDAMNGERVITINVPVPTTDKDGNRLYPHIDDLLKDK